MAAFVKVTSAANGARTPHDGRWVKAWNPHTRFGVLELTSTDKIAEARQFAGAAEAYNEWRTISDAQPRRTDGKANRPLTGLTIEIIPGERIQ